MRRGPGVFSHVNPLTARGWSALVLAAGCLAAGDVLALAELRYVAVFLIAVTLLCLASLWLGVRLISADRVVSTPTLAVGATVNVRIQLRLVSPLPVVAARWMDAPPDALAMERTRRGDVVGVVPPIRSSFASRSASIPRVVLGYSARAERRGVWRFGAMRVELHDPLGIARRTITRRTAAPRTDDAITIVPALVPLTSHRLARGDTGRASDTLTESLGQGSDNLVPRSYLSGDSMRRIHWRASAHRGELMVRQEERETTPEARVVLDLSAHRWQTEPGGGSPAFESALSLVVSTVARLEADGFVVRAETPDGHLFTEPEASGAAPSILTALRHALARVDVSDTDLLHRLDRDGSGDTAGPIVVVAGMLEDAAAHAISRAARGSRLPALVSIVAAPIGLEQLSPRPSTVRGPWRRADVVATGDLAHDAHAISRAWDSLVHARLALLDSDPGRPR